MKPSENSLVMSDENAFKVLVALINEYERRGFTNSSNLATFFFLGDFISKSANTKELITHYKLKIEQGRYSDLSISQTLLNGMVRSGYLKLDTGKYYLSETGYNKGYKLTHPYKYFIAENKMIITYIIIAIATVMVTLWSGVFASEN